MTEQNVQQMVQEFERNRQQLVAVSSQKQNLQMQSTAIGQALEELKKTKEKKVYKAVGNILIHTDVKDVQKELKEQDESVALRVKSFQAQEDALIEKLNKLKSQLEASAKAAQPTAPKKEAK